MSLRKMWASVFLLILTSVLVLGQSQKREDLVSLLIPLEEQRQCGLHKLSEVERSALAGVFARLIQSQALGNSAKNYLENGGWDEVNVVGTRRLQLDEWSIEDEYLIVEKSPWTYILDPKTYAFLLPGTYLGKMGFSDCEIIDANGRTVDFWTKKQR